jgi:GAF domain-containing protein
MSANEEPLSTHLPLTERYVALTEAIGAVVEGERNLIARMATVTSMLAQSFDHFYWTGFYLVDPEDGDQLVVGPYQGTLGCLRIERGRGVCGAAAVRRETLIVPDVSAFPGHIACDPKSRSEIVVPVIDGTGRLIAVLDVDSVQADAFSHVDASGLETIIRTVFGG